jgi:hypothetical protein
MEPIEARVDDGDDRTFPLGHTPSLWGPYALGAPEVEMGLAPGACAREERIVERRAPVEVHPVVGLRIRDMGVSPKGIEQVFDGDTLGNLESIDVCEVCSLPVARARPGSGWRSAGSGRSPLEQLAAPRQCIPMPVVTRCASEDRSLDSEPETGLEAIEGVGAIPRGIPEATPCMRRDGLDAGLDGMRTGRTVFHDECGGLLASRHGTGNGCEPCNAEHEAHH